MKKLLLSLVVVAGLSLILGFRWRFKSTADASDKGLTGAKIKTVDSTFVAEGSVRSQNEANLHFLTSGKLAYIPVKEGDPVKKYQTIASLDTYTVQKQLEVAMNNYRAAKSSYDQTKDSSENDVLKKQITTPYNLYTLSGMDKEERNAAIDEAIHRLVAQSESSLSNAQVQIELAKYAFSFSSITAPFDGMLVHADINTPNIMATTQTTYTVIDPKALIFKANVPEDQINYISEGSKAAIKLNGIEESLDGIVKKVYPDKITLSNGSGVYQVDIASDKLSNLSKYKQNGVALITNNNEKEVLLVPSWAVLNNKYIWVNKNGTDILKEVKIGGNNGSEVEILSGLSSGDELVTNPENIVLKRYSVL